MSQTIRIQMMDSFAIYINETVVEQLNARSRKGAALLEYLIVHRGKAVDNTRILSTLWTEEKSSNPENALRALISRLRVILGQVSPGLEECLVSTRGAYQWVCAENMTIDLYEIQDLLDHLEQELPQAERRAAYTRLLGLYKGDLLQSSKNHAWVQTEAAMLHGRYINAVLAYVELLKEQGEHEEIISVCRKALEIDQFDDKLHMELMSALVQINHTGEALQQYKHATEINYRYLGVQPSEELQDFYKQIVTTGKTLNFNLDAIRTELNETAAQRNAFVCEYTVFKEIFNLQMRNLERLGASIFLVIVMVRPYDGQVMDSLRQNNVMNALLEILRNNLRKGDVITRFAPSIFALMLPTVNYTTGNMVMERIKRLFYRKYPNSNIVIEYRVGPLTSESDLPKQPDEQANSGRK